MICESDIDYDGGKKTKGRKSLTVFDSLVLVMIVVAQDTNIRDRVSVSEVMCAFKDKHLMALIRFLLMKACVKIDRDA